MRREHAELVLAELLELAPAGVEEVPIGRDTIEYAVYGAPGELPTLPALTAAAGGALIEISTQRSPTTGTSAGAVPQTVGSEWPAHGTSTLGAARHDGDRPRDRPGAGVWDRCPRHHPVVPGADARAGAAAGAGAFVDLGCGSGVLAIAAARLGWAPVLALDNDPASVEAARANAKLNGVEIDVCRHDLRVDADPRRDRGRESTRPAVARVGAANGAGE